MTFRSPHRPADPAPAPALSDREAEIVARFEAAPVLAESWQPKHAEGCTITNRSDGWYPADCERCDRSANGAHYRLGGAS